MLGGRGWPISIYFSLFEDKCIHHFNIFVRTLVSKYLLNFSKPHEGTFFSAQTLWPYNQFLHCVYSYVLFSIMCLNKPPGWYFYKNMHAIPCLILHKLYQEWHFCKETMNHKDFVSLPSSWWLLTVALQLYKTYEEHGQNTLFS